MCLEVIIKNPKIVSEYKSGKKKLFNALLGQIAKDTEQCADMAIIAKIMERLLNSKWNYRISFIVKYICCENKISYNK